MHPFLALAVLCAYAWCAMSLLPFLLALCGGFVLLYALAGSLLHAPPMSTRRKLMAATWEAPSEGTIFGVITINAEPLMAYLEKVRREGAGNRHAGRQRPHHACRLALDSRRAGNRVQNSQVRVHGSLLRRSFRCRSSPLLLLRQLAARGTKISVTTAVVRALALALRDAPSFNSRLVLGRFIPHSTIDVSCLVALDDGKDLANAKIATADRKTLIEIAGELKSKAEKLRAHKDADFEKSKPLLAMLPVFVLKPLVHTIGYLSGALGLNIPALGVRPFPFGSCLVTSVGMLGIEQAFVPFTPFTRVPLLMAVGEVTKRAVVDANEKIIAQRQFTLTATVDHRFIDGSEAARFGKKLRALLETPQLLDADASDSDIKPRK